ncbi:MAG: hypothetical protein EZS28_050206 [Streblomastix strix]|uniref:Dynein heavy chain n=1 Tax=Streblomastix strix TaxID=222440 RepID=A0A5J4T7N9_9EUKA|nr:MAG: hypothetical protein EZS28_050206 [Streblomastix strix]
METQFIAIKPRLEVSQKDIIVIIQELTVQQKEVEGKEEVVCGEEAIVTQQANEIETLAEDAQNNLNKAIPKYNVAIKAVQSYDKIDISEDKSYSRSSELVIQKINERRILGKLYDYDKDILDEKMKVKLRATYINSHKFQHEVVENVSKAAKTLYLYSHVDKEVECYWGQKQSVLVQQQ